MKRRNMQDAAHIKWQVFGYNDAETELRMKKVFGDDYNYGCSITIHIDQLKVCCHEKEDYIHSFRGLRIPPKLFLLINECVKKQSWYIHSDKNKFDLEAAYFGSKPNRHPAPYYAKMGFCTPIAMCSETFGLGSEAILLTVRKVELQQDERNELFRQWLVHCARDHDKVPQIKLNTRDHGEVTLQESEKMVLLRNAATNGHTGADRYKGEWPNMYMYLRTNELYNYPNFVNAKTEMETTVAEKASVTRPATPTGIAMLQRAYAGASQKSQRRPSFA